MYRDEVEAFPIRMENSVDKHNTILLDVFNEEVFDI
jgi:hypothetical protein